MICLRLTLLCALCLVWHALSPQKALAADPQPMIKQVYQAQVVKPQPTIQNMKFIKAVIFKPGKDIKDAGGVGPSPQQIDLLVKSDIDENLYQQGCALSRWVYEDQEKSSGLYYFFPREFRLAWDKRSGYALRFQYNTKEDASDKTAVLMTATLVGNYNIEDRNVVEHMVRESVKGKQAFKEIKPLPIYDMQISLDPLSVGFDIPSEQITATPVNNIGGEIKVTVAMSETNIEEMIAALQTYQGIGGYFSFPLEEGETPKVVNIPIQLSFCDYAVVGKGRWKRGDPFVNLSDFPVRLKKLIVLTKQQNRIESYDYKLGDQIIAPRKEVPLQASAIRQDPNVLKYIFETELQCTECTECMDKVVASLRQGIGQTRIENLEVTVIPNVFDAFNLFEVVVMAESPYFTPTATAAVSREIIFTSDNNVSKEIPVYLDSANTKKFKGKGPVLRYRIAVITNEGERFEGANWIESDFVKGNYIGKKQVEPILKGGVESHAPVQRTLY